MSTVNSLQDHWPESRHDGWMSETGRAGLVSVIVPTYNRADLLRAALDSVYAQTYRPIELLVVDDGSTDSTPEVLRDWTRNHDEQEAFEVRTFRQSNSGAPAARNRGLIEAHGEFIQLLDSDDRLHPEKLEAHVSLLRDHPGADFVWSPIRYFESTSELEDELKRGRAPDVRETGTVERPEDAANPVTVLMRRSVYRAAGPWHEELPRWQDWEYAFRLCMLGPQYLNTDASYYFVRLHEQGRIGDLVGSKEGVAANLKALRAIEELERWTENRAAVHTIRRLYTRTLRMALHYGTDAEVEACIDGLRAHCRSAGNWVRSNGFFLLWKIAGRRVCRALLERHFQRLDHSGA
jgi:glycosyltransferase involved in cell wall biosynthesis